ncbi:hypothetical protein TNCV_1525831 [Trichonephila clavipes]|nr:hypothetical protein TNCV_1525831 [Trichonephila clavipes]
MHPRQPRFVEVARVSPPKCNGRPLLGRSSFLIEDRSGAKTRSVGSASVAKIVQKGIFPYPPIKEQQNYITADCSALPRFFLTCSCTVIV